MRINPWLKKSKQNLIPLSISNNFSDALKEWFFTGDVEDHLGQLVECEMCEHPELRYHFEIKNRLKENTLWVGSSCIERFEEIEVFDENGVRLITEESRKKELKRQLKKRLEELMLQPLRDLWKTYPKGSEQRDQILKAVQHYKKQSGFTPRDLLLLFSRLEKKNIAYESKRYKLSLRSEYNKSFVSVLTKKELNKLHPCFSREQLKKNQELLVKLNE